MEVTTTLALFAIVAAMGLVGVVAIGMLSVPQDTEAAGCFDALLKTRNTAIAFGINASQGRCVH